jgi:23S rRNA pseudouridine2605 synthase
MVFKRPGNGRDEKAGRSSSRTTKSADRPKRSTSSRGGSSKSSDKTDWNKPEKKNPTERSSDRRSSSASSDRRSSSSSSERKPYAGSSEHKSSFTGGEKKSYSPRKPYSGRPADGGDGAKPYAQRSKPYSGRVSSADSGSSDRPKRSSDSYRSSSEGGGDKKPFSSARPKSYSGRPTSESSDRPKRSFGNDDGGDKKSFSSSRPKTYSNRATSESSDRPKSPDSYRSRGEEGGERKFSKKPETEGGFRKRTESGSEPFRKSAKSSYNKITPDRDAPVKTLRSRKEKERKDDGLIRLNRYIANAGICSRRKADELIEAGVVSVNNIVINELGHKIDPMKDEIRYNGELLKREKMVYVLLNKPKDYITTTEDPQERRTVMHLVEKASKERIYPIGRLDRNTTGLLLMTNDGDLADKLSHPRSNITKLYQVELNKSLAQGDMNKIQYGLELEDGLIKPDSISYVTGASKREIGIQIHSGKNRIVRRIFEHLGYEVVKLDRVIYAGLTKKDLTRGRWRYLDEKEIIQLKHLIQ